MPRLAAGDTMPDFEYATPYAAHNRLSETAAKCAGRTAVVFLRYYGCRICQLDIIDFTGEYGKIRAKGGQLLVVLQSDPTKLAAKIPQGELPFEIACDPDQTLYKAFDIRPAASKEAMKDENSAAKTARIAASNLVHGEYEGEELQLPAAFVIDRNRVVTYAHYGRVITDVPTAGELAELLG